MIAANFWDILGVLAFLCLAISFFIGKNSVIGAFVWGMLFCIAIAEISLFVEGGINWELLKNILSVSGILGALIELEDRMATFRKQDRT